MQQEPNSRAKLCLSHMEAVASHVRARYPTTAPLMWDDMLRDIPEDQLSGWWIEALAGGGGGAGHTQQWGFLVPRGVEAECSEPPAAQERPRPCHRTAPKLLVPDHSVMRTTFTCFSYDSAISLNGLAGGCL